MYKKKIENFFRKKTNFKFISFSGRTNTHIWRLGLYLKKKFKKPTIILPSTMCVSPAIIFTLLNIKIEYVDINYKTGLAEEDSIKKKIKEKKINAVFFVNLFGNIGSKSFIKFTKKNKILIIQDLAQTFVSNSSRINRKELFGDIILISFGYSKIFDLGEGALMLTNNIEVKNYVNNNNFKHKNISNKDKEVYYQKYLSWYNLIFTKTKKISKSDLISFARKLYIKSIKKKIYHKIYNEIKELKNVETRRRKLLNFYKLVFNSKKIKFLHSGKVLIPWRFTFLVKKNRSKILYKLRSNGFDASSYYLSLSKKKLGNSIKIEKEAINLWLTQKISEKTIKNQYKIIKNLL